MIVTDLLRLVVLSMLASAIAVLAVRILRLEVKVDTLWDYALRRAISEAMQPHVVDHIQRMSIERSARSWIEPLRADLQDFYRTKGYKLGERELAMQVERLFGARLLDEIGIPHGLSVGACLRLALDVAKEPH